MIEIFHPLSIQKGKLGWLHFLCFKFIEIVHLSNNESPLSTSERPELIFYKCWQKIQSRSGFGFQLANLFRELFCLLFQKTWQQEFLTCGWVSPVKQNIPIWSVIWLQSFWDPSRFKFSLNLLLTEIILSAIPFTSSNLYRTRNIIFRHWRK